MEQANVILHNPGVCPVKHDETAPTKEQDSGSPRTACPVNPRNVMPVDGVGTSEERGGSNLSTDRVASTIPVAEPETLPEHQKVSKGENGNSTWLYPSEEMFFAAMKRKVLS